jgi:hypothetical protein
MRLYREAASVDWVQFTAPRSLDQVCEARQVVDGPFSVMESHLPALLNHAELLTTGITIQWAPGATHLAAQIAVYELVRAYLEQGPAALRVLREHHRGNPYADGRLARPGAAVVKQRELEARYFATPARYFATPARQVLT